MPDGFRREFEDVFRTHGGRLTRVLDRVSGDPDLAADLVQEAFVRLYTRGAMPESPGAWLVSVAFNLLRNAKATAKRRGELLAQHAVEAASGSDAGRQPPDGSERVRRALSALGDRERQLLMLRAEGYSYREIAITLELNDGSIGTLLARAKEMFRRQYEGESCAS